jgi:hypothetical protein
MILLTLTKSDPDGKGEGDGAVSRVGSMALVDVLSVDFVSSFVNL